MQNLSRTKFAAIKLRHLLAGFHKEAKGVAALEFALIAPILLLLFLGTLEISLAIAVDRKISRISSAVADLITQSQTLSSQEIEDIMDIADNIMFPYDDVPRIVVTGIEIKSGAAKVVWSQARNGGVVKTVGSNYTVPETIKTDGTFLVAATVDTTHKPAFKFIGYKDGELSFSEAAIELGEEIFLRPRIGDAVSRN